MSLSISESKSVADWDKFLPAVCSSKNCFTICNSLSFNNNTLKFNVQLFLKLTLNIQLYTSFSLATGIPPNANAVYANAGLKQTSYLWSRQGGYFKSRSADDLGEISLIYYVEAVGGYTYTQGEITSSIMLPIIESQTLYYKCFNRSGNLVRGDANCDNDGPSPSDDGGGTAILFRVTGWELP